MYASVCPLELIRVETRPRQRITPMRGQTISEKVGAERRASVVFPNLVILLRYSAPRSRREILMGKLIHSETELSNNLVLKGSRVTPRIVANPVMLAPCYIIDRRRVKLTFPQHWLCDRITVILSLSLSPKFLVEKLSIEVQKEKKNSRRGIESRGMRVRVVKFWNAYKRNISSRRTSKPTSFANFLTPLQTFATLQVYFSEPELSVLSTHRFQTAFVSWKNERLKSMSNLPLFSAVRDCLLFQFHEQISVARFHAVATFAVPPPPRRRSFSLPATFFFRLNSQASKRD